MSNLLNNTLSLNSRELNISFIVTKNKLSAKLVLHSCSVTQNKNENIKEQSLPNTGRGDNTLTYPISHFIYPLANIKECSAEYCDLLLIVSVDERL